MMATRSAVTAGNEVSHPYIVPSVNATMLCILKFVMAGTLMEFQMSNYNHHTLFIISIELEGNISPIHPSLSVPITNSLQK